jgi:glycyl-radical enzyme activating protein
MENKGLVLDILRFSVHDGPGIRTTIFLKGCPLHCIWCHNPESIKSYPEIAYFESRCTGCGDCIEVCPTGAQHILEGVHYYNRKLCQLCYKCTEVCNFDALRKVGKMQTVNEIITEVLKDKEYYLQSGGGITISGGEPLLQYKFSLEILKAAKNAEIHTCIETSGYATKKVIESILQWSDLILFDFKASSDSHLRLTGGKSKIILQNLEFIVNSGKQVEIRCPLVPGVNDTQSFFSEIAQLSEKFSHKIPIRIMPYHNTGNGKLERFGYPAALKGIDTVSEENVRQWKEELSSFGDIPLI